MNPITDGDDDDGDDDEVEIVLDPRCFAERVYDMVVLAEQVDQWKKVVKWEAGGQSFSMAKNSPQLSDIVALQFESKCPSRRIASHVARTCSFSGRILTLFVGVLYRVCRSLDMDMKSFRSQLEKFGWRQISKSR